VEDIVYRDLQVRDVRQVFDFNMHGAVAWRSKLLGWRGPYVGDALGWHERARRHFTYWAAQQNTNPLSTAPPVPDPTVNFARNEPTLHTNGDMSKFSTACTSACGPVTQG
jgi:hypothetical protein